jgi:hypothetical protein
MTKTSVAEIVKRTLIGVVLLLCFVGAALMLVLPANSLKVDAVYQKF